jgi:L-fucose isomerase-like protein
VIALPRIGIMPLARQTFDVPFAEETATRAFAALDSTGAEIVGPRRLLYDAESTRTAIDTLKAEAIDLVLVMQVTFSDASMTEVIGRELEAPIALWAFPEERTGGRLRLNSFCGINLAGHALQRIGRTYGYLYRDPAADGIRDAILGLVGASPLEARAWPVPGTDGVASAAMARAEEVRGRLAQARVAVIGEHPVGFVPCAFDPVVVSGLLGTKIEAIALSELFDRAQAAGKADVAGARARAAGVLDGITAFDAAELDKSLRFFPALRALAADGGYAALAVRCWPECFTEYGGALCASAAMMSEDRIPTACEADAYGALTTLMLQWLGDGPALIADLVDADFTSGTGVLWHCGNGAASMADPEGPPPVATLHSNRRKPLLHEFAFRPGRITIARLSRRRNEHALVVGGGEMIRARLAFSGSAGVVRFDRPLSDVVDTIMTEGLEHHYGFVYGDVRAELHALAAGWNIPVVQL